MKMKENMSRREKREVRFGTWKAEVKTDESKAAQ